MNETSSMPSRKLRILVEASGSLTSGYLIKAIRDSHAEAVGSDVVNLSCANCLADDFLQLPNKNDPGLWDKLKVIIQDNRIDLVIPSFDEMMIGWAERVSELGEIGCQVIISPLDTIKICQDKWKTFEFFSQLDIPTPETSLSQIHPLVKPRFGRGGKGVAITEDAIDMSDMISQAVVAGTELTVDAFFDRDHQPVYIVPRRRIGVINGKSTGGEVVKDEEVESYIRRISEKLPFIGPINFQCFVNDTGAQFIEINPRVAGGMALGFAASENWVNLIIGNLVYGKKIDIRPIRYGLKMVRYYAECFVP